MKSDPFGPGTVLGYCTNVHAGVRVADVQRALAEHACGVKRLVSPGAPLPIGLWLSVKAAKQLVGDPGLFEAFRAFLLESGLAPFTFNAFPWGDFHGARVKHRVYEPDWSNYERLEYTIAIAAIAADLAPGGAAMETVSISTLPIGWRGDVNREPTCDAHAAAGSLRAVARHLARVEAETGRCIHLDLEPEPGCILESAGGLVRFFSEHLLRGARADEAYILRHLRVCHDVCHSAVMFEDQAEALRTYAAAGIGVGKVQISAAVECDFSARDAAERGACLGALRGFAEDRYLHQTVVMTGDGRRRFFDDLPAAIEQAGAEAVADGGVWRTHFHVPVFAGRMGLLSSTADQIAPAIGAARKLHDTRHFEIETYAWGVLPMEMRAANVAEGIAAEFRHVLGLGVSGAGA